MKFTDKNRKRGFRRAQKEIARARNPYKPYAFLKTWKRGDFWPSIPRFIRGEHDRRCTCGNDMLKSTRCGVCARYLYVKAGGLSLDESWELIEYIDCTPLQENYLSWWDEQYSQDSEAVCSWDKCYLDDYLFDDYFDPKWRESCDTEAFCISDYNSR